jgi:thiol-disulfide isomerase/thioredoxin
MNLSKYLMIAAIFIYGCNETANKEQKQKKEQVQEQPVDLIDRIQLVDLDGNDLPLDQFKGKTVFLNFWATWCRPCLAEMPDIDSAANILNKEGFVFLAASDEKPEKIKKFASGFDYSFQFVHSKSSMYDLDIMNLPTTMIINKNGEIVYNEIGAKDWASETEIENLRKWAQE